MSSVNPLFQLIVCNMKGYLREPEAIFWTYGFPLLMVIGLGVAFDTSGRQALKFDVVEGETTRGVLSSLGSNPDFGITVKPKREALIRLRRNQTQLVVALKESGGYEYHYDPSNPEARNIRMAVDDALQRSAGRPDSVMVDDVRITAPGSRYVDFLVPGLIGMNLMGGGMWGVGFVLVDMRMKKLLKRLLGTPMRRPQFLLSIVGTRVIFFLPEAFFLLLSAYFIFGVPIKGSLVSIVVVAFLGAMCFSGVGLLAASRAQRIETISGIMNVIMLPMWLCSGIFFSAERFPSFMQPFVQALPLTQLIGALRAVVLEGRSLLSQTFPLVYLLLWATLSFIFALKLFRWT